MEQRTFHFINGEVLLIDKPVDWTSFDAVKKVRSAIRAYLARAGDVPEGARAPKVGHAGTLDPLATGLLIICTGKKTREIDRFQAGEKEYTGSFHMGATTPSYDRETTPEQVADPSALSPDALRRLAEGFTGTIMQVPPAHSAIKTDGARAYAKARKGQDVRLAPRPVEIRSFDITRVELPLVHFSVVCTKGTYIRSLAHDFGQAAGTGAYLQSLRRTRIGEFHVKDALSPDDFAGTLHTPGRG